MSKSSFELKGRFEKSLHLPFKTLGCRSLVAQESAHSAAAKAAEEARAEEAPRSKGVAAIKCEDARAFWTSQAPAGSSIERTRMRMLQDNVVRPLVEQSVRRHMLGQMPPPRAQA